MPPATVAATQRHPAVRRLFHGASDRAARAASQARDAFELASYRLHDCSIVRANRSPAEVVRRGRRRAPCVPIRTSAARQRGRKFMLRRTMPNQVAVRAAGDGGALALPGDDSYEFVFDRNPTPIWFHDPDTHRFLGLTPGVVTPWACQGPRALRQSSPAVLPVRMASRASASPRVSVRCPDSRRPCRALHPRWR